MLDFVNYLKENFKEDVSSAEKIIQAKWAKVVAVIKEAFDDPYSDKKTALYKIQNEFIDSKIAPKTIDVDFLRNNMDYVLDKINSLDEGDVKIIINTGDVQKGGSTRASITGMETEGKKSRKDVVKEETDEVEEPAEMMGTDGGSQAGAEEEEKVVKVSVADNKVTVEPSENTGLETSEHEFENEEEANGFVQSLETLFKGFKVEKEDSNENSDEIETGAAEEEMHQSTEESIKIKQKLVKEDTNELNDVAEEPEDAGEEPEDAGEEPEDAGEEPEDAGEEPEDAGEEPEDAGEFDWEDIMASSEEEGDAEEFVAPVRPIGSSEFESLDLNKLINTLVRVDSKWYKVGSITENNEVICVDKEGNESYFDLDQIEEMEHTLGELAKSAVAPNAGEEEVEEAEEEPEDAEEETCPDDAEECVPGEKGSEEEVKSVARVLTPEQMEIVQAWISNETDELPDEIYQILFDYYSDEMPYEIQKARTGDPYEWLADKISQELGGDNDDEGYQMSDVEADADTLASAGWGTDEDYGDFGGGEEEAETKSHILSRTAPTTHKEKVRKALPKLVKQGAEEETSETQEESLSFAKMANRWMDLEEDSLSPPNMLNTQTGGLTSKPGVVNQKIEPIKSAPTAATVKGPTAALTAKPSKPGEKIEKIPSAPTVATKKAPQQALTSKPKAPPKKIDKVKNPPKGATKKAPTGKFTANPMKSTGQKMDKVGSPAIPKEYSKGGHKG